MSARRVRALRGGCALRRAARIAAVLVPLAAAGSLRAQQPAGALDGQIVDAVSGDPVDGAFVRIFVDGRLAGGSLVGDAGRYSFTGIRGDSIRLHVEALGFEPYEIGFTAADAGGTPGRDWLLLMRPIRLARAARAPTAADSAAAPVNAFRRFIGNLKFAPEVRAQTSLVLGRPGEALSGYRRTADSLAAAGDRSAHARVLMELGNAYRLLGREDSAMAGYAQAGALYRALGDASGSADALHAVGRLQMQAGAADAARASLERALRMRRMLRDSPGVASILHSIGGLFVMTRQPDSAAAYLGAALRQAREDDRPGILLDLAHVQRLSGRPDSALALIRRAHRSSAYSGPTSRASYLTALGSALLVEETRDLRRASIYLDSAAAIYASMAADVRGDGTRISFVETIANVYERWALAELLRFRQSREPDHVLAALGITERGRAQSLRLLMGAPPDTVRAGADLAAEGRAITSAVSAPGRSVVTYLVTADETLIWLLHEDGIDFDVRSVGADSLASLVDGLRSALLSEGIEEPFARLLREALLPERLARGPGTELVIVPHGPATLVPFSALRLANGTRLIDRHRIRVVPSLHVLRDVDRRPAPPRHERARALIVGNPRMPNVPAEFGDEVIVLQDLPNAEREADSVRAILGASIALKGASASEAVVRRRMADARVIHLATHGFIYPEESRTPFSFVALADDPDSSDDGVLTVSEILDDTGFTLTADLVVLSACETALGDLTRTEGILGLQRAFIARGARSVVASLWRVSDEATALFMPEFYRAWHVDGLTKAEALRRGQAALRRDPRFAEPRYWAAFRLVGAN